MIYYCFKVELYGFSDSATYSISSIQGEPEHTEVRPFTKLLHLHFPVFIFFILSRKRRKCELQSSNQIALHYALRNPYWRGQGLKFNFPRSRHNLEVKYQLLIVSVFLIPTRMCNAM